MSGHAGMLQVLLSDMYPGHLAPEHREDLQRSGLTDDTVRCQKIRSVPPWMITPLLGFDLAAIRSAYILPYADTCGGWMDHIRLRVFPPVSTPKGTVKYLQPCRSGVRLFFTLATLEAVRHGPAPLWLLEGEKKSLSVAQLGLPAVGIPGIEGWHTAGSPALLADFDRIPLRGRIVELVPDGDVITNPHVRRGAERLAEALEVRGAGVRLVRLPAEVAK